MKRSLWQPFWQVVYRVRHYLSHEFKTIVSNFFNCLGVALSSKFWPYVDFWLWFIDMEGGIPIRTKTCWLCERLCSPFLPEKHGSPRNSRKGKLTRCKLNLIIQLQPGRVVTLIPTKEEVNFIGNIRQANVMQNDISGHCLRCSL